MASFFLTEKEKIRVPALTIYHFCIFCRCARLGFLGLPFRLSFFLPGRLTLPDARPAPVKHPTLPSLPRKETFPQRRADLLSDYYYALSSFCLPFLS